MTAQTNHCVREQCKLNEKPIMIEPRITYPPCHRLFFAVKSVNVKIFMGLKMTIRQIFYRVLHQMVN